MNDAEGNFESRSQRPPCHPAAMRQALGVTKGGKLIARLEDGVLSLETVETTVRRAQAILRQYIPEGVSLVDELIAERREAAKLEWDRLCEFCRSGLAWSRLRGASAMTANAPWAKRSAFDIVMIRIS